MKRGMNMIGRSKEMKELQKLYDSKKAELVAVYGRRRVGKTHLVSQCFAGKFFFRHAGLSPEEEKIETPSIQLEKQLNQFYMNLLSYGLKGEKKPNDWFEAFFLLRKLLCEKDDGSRQVVFIDELPWMDTPNSSFVQAFEGFWNSFGCGQDSLLLIVCGSATSWMENHLINDHGGLYGRTTYEIKLAPFTLCECEELLREKGLPFSRYEIACAYMTFGGIPFYLNYLESEYSLAQNIDNLFFKKGARLALEFDRLFRSTFTYGEKAKEIVRLLHSNSVGFTRKEIAAKTGIKEGGTLTNYLNGLIASDFVLKYVPFGFDKKEPYFKLIDPFCLFYLNFASAGGENENYFSENLSSSKLNAYLGLSFENLCFNHIPQIKFALGISGVSTASSALYSKEDGTQIDMLLTRKDNVINLCEMKFCSKPFKADKECFFKMSHRAEVVKGKVAKKFSIRNTLISAYGLEKSEYWGAFVNVVTLDDLFKF